MGRQTYNQIVRVLAVCISIALLLTNVSSAQATTPASPTFPSWFKSSTIYEVNIRNYTKDGTFKAFATHLPRLKALGVDVLWLMPIYPVSEKNRKCSTPPAGTCLGSPYSVGNYTAVNPDMGTEDDFKDLVNQAHTMGFKVILDWVANHTGWDNPWITAHKNWYQQDEQGNIIWPPGTDWSDVAQLDYTNTDLRTAMVDAMKYWVNTFDVDGFRCDAAGMVPTDFWEDASTELNAIKPVLMLAENQDNMMLLDHAFVMNYNWGLLGQMNQIGEGTFYKSMFQDFYTTQTGLYPSGSFPMNFITNHDENSWNGTEYQRLGKGVRAMSALYFTVPGAPLIYSGQEIGLNKRLKFFEKDQITWKNSPITAFYRKLIALKKANSALWNGKSGSSLKFLSNSSENVLSFVRANKSDKVIVLINPTSKQQKVKVNFSTTAGTYNAFTLNKRVILGKQRSFTLPAWSFEIYSTKPAK